MAEISKIKLPSGTVYDLKDSVARAAQSGAIILRGTTTTALTDEATTNPITINGASYTAVSNDAVFYGKREFVFDGTKWHEFGDMSGLGALAAKDSASGSFTPSGSVTVTTASTENKTATVSPASSGTATYTPAGSISGIAWTGASTTSTGSFTPAGSVSLTNTNKTATVSAASSGTTTYTPAGSVAAPTISVASAGSTATVHNPTKKTVTTAVTAAALGATAPSNVITYYSVADETLSLYQLGYTTGDSITTSDVTVKTGDASYSASAPAFSGTAVRLVTGNISVPSSASFSGTEGSVSVTGTSAGSISSQGTFSGTGVRLMTGNIAVPKTYDATFTGTAGTVTVS